jgi:hypothetical protein
MLTRFILPTALLLVVALGTTFSSCKKEEAAEDCFDANLKALHENDMCTEEWRGVTGCDGKLYGNECQANAQGIAIVP